MSFLNKLENTVYLPFTLRLASCVILGITVWKGVHGFFPTAGVLIGGAMVLVGGMFSKIYR